MAYDQLGNYIGEYDTQDSYDYGGGPIAPDNTAPIYQGETEEERRKREEEEAKAAGESVQHEQKVVTYADGSRTVETKQEVPPSTPVEPVQPTQPTGNRVAPVQPIAPMRPEDQAAYNANIQQQESGARPDIGYHDQTKSSAFGPFGMTAGAYQDARKLDPSLPQDIRQANPEQMTRAQNAYTQQNASYLQSYGIQPTANTLAAAHFAGAKGLSDFMTKKDEFGRPFISPQAQAANGGYDKAAAIINSRLGGQPAAASGAAQQRPQMGPVSPEQADQQAQQFAQQFKQYQPVSPEQAQAQPQPAVEEPKMAPNSYDEFGTPVYSPEQKQLDTQLKTLESIQNDPRALMNFDGPDWMKDRAKNRAADLLAAERDNQKAKEEITKMDPTDLAKHLRNKDDDTLSNRIKAMLFSWSGNTVMAQRYMDKIEPGKDQYLMGADGKPYMLTVKANGEVTGGFNAETGKALNESEMVKVAAGATAQKGAHQAADQYADPAGKVKGTFVLETRAGATPIYKEIGTGRPATAEESAVLRKTGVAGTLADQLASQRQKLQEQTRFMAPQEALKFYGRFDAENKTNFAEEYKAQNPQYFTPGAVAGAPQGQAGAAPGSATSIPGNTALPADTSAPTTSQAASAPTGNSPAAIKSARERQAEEEKSKLKIGEKQTEGIIKHVNETVVPASMAAQEGSDAVKRQFKIINEPTSDALFGLYNKAQSNSATDKNWAIIRDFLGGKLDPNDQTQISQAIAKVKLDSNEEAAYILFAAETTRLANAAVKSGVYGAQISNADRTSAEKSQLDIAATPALAIFAGKAQQLFGFDMARAKSEWSADKNFATVPQLEKAWSKEQSRLVEQYGKVADERNAFIKANSDNKPATIGLVRKAYQMYPVPQYDPNLNDGNGGWRNMRRRDVNDILKGNR